MTYSFEEVREILRSDLSKQEKKDWWFKFPIDFRKAYVKWLMEYWDKRHEQRRLGKI